MLQESVNQGTLKVAEKFTSTVANIYATSSGNGAGVGGGGTADASAETMKIGIYGGIISAGGSTYAIWRWKEPEYL